MPAPLQTRKEIRLYVPQEELAKEGALGSLEGRPVSIDHIWQSTLGTQDVGNIAGTPTYDPASKMVFADILVTDSDAIERITADDDDPGKLVEQSAGYLMEVDWTPGITEDGEQYDGIQRNIQYNHVALVGEGEGRAGSDVRILNKRSKNMSNELTLMKVGNSKIHVLNKDVDSLEKEMDAKESLIANLINRDEYDKVKSELTGAHSRLEKAQNEVQEKSGKIEELRAMIEELQNPDILMEAANKMVKEREEADKVYNSLKGRVDDATLQEASEKAKSLQGVDLHRHVVTSVRAMNKKPDLSKEDLDNDASLRGRFDTLVELSDVSEKSQISGLEMTKTLNKKMSDGLTEDPNSQESREKRLKQFHDNQLAALKR